MPNLNLNPETLESIKSIVNGSLNDGVLNAVGPLSSFLQNNPSDNPMEEKIAEACKAFESTYNDLTNTLDKVRAEVNNIDEIREFLEKKDHGEVLKAAMADEAKGVDKSFF